MKPNFFFFTTSAIAFSLTGATAAFSLGELVSAETDPAVSSQAEASVSDTQRAHVQIAQAANSAPAAEGDAAEAADQSEAGAAVEVSEDEMAALMEAGGQHYSDFCAACHDEDGSGNVGPALAGLEALENPELVYSQIAQGSGEMPAFDSVLDPEDIYAVGTYIRNSWGNDFGPVTEENAQSEQ